MLRLPALAALLLAAAPRGAKAADLGSYNFHPTSVEGSARDIGIGGAGVALPRDYSAVFVNPAGLGGLAGTGIDFGSDSNNIDNVVFDADNPKAKALNDPINFSFFGVRYVTEDGWGFGFAKQTPFDLHNTFQGTSRVTSKKQCLVNGHLVNCTTTQTIQDQTELDATDNTYTLAVGKSFLDRRLSLGLSVNYVQVAETYLFTPVLPSTAPVDLRATDDALSADVGLLARPVSWLQFGAAYKMGYRVPFDAARNESAVGTKGTVNAFRDGRSPSRVSLGLAWLPSDSFRVFVQTNYVFKMKDGVVAASGLFPGGSNILGAGQYDTIDGHWGAEFIPIDTSDLTFKLWAGGYLENTGLQGGYSRYHRTAGFGLSPWFLSLSMAVDDAEYYNNFSVGLGIDLLEVASRVSQTYGWKLPL